MAEDKSAKPEEKVEQSGKAGSGSAGKTPQSNARLFAMPERYRHGKEVKMHVPEKPKPKAKPVPPPVVVKPKKKAPAGLKKKHGMSGSTKALLIAGAIVIAALLVGGYLMLRSSLQNQPEPVNQQPVVVEEQETEPEEEEPTDNETIPDGSESPFSKTNTPGIDTDSDGLTDIEETLVYGTNARLPDSDKDGFLDGNEVFHKYNPNGTQPGTLLEANLVLSLNAGVYTILYPSKWAVLPGSDLDYTVSITTGEKITLNLVQKTAGQTLADWYIGQGDESVVVPSITKNSYQQLITEDQLTSYVELGDAVLVLDYDTGIKGTVDYLQSFQLMINSVEKVFQENKPPAE